MKVTSRIIAVAVLALGAGTVSLPAAADYGDFGQWVYTEQSPSRFAGDGYSNRRNAVRQSNRGFSSSQQRQAIYDQLDRAHKAY